MQLQVDSHTSNLLSQVPNDWKSRSLNAASKVGLTKLLKKGKSVGRKTDELQMQMTMRVFALQLAQCKAGLDSS